MAPLLLTPWPLSPCTAHIPVPTVPDRDWLCLPKHLLDLVLERLESLEDCLVFSLVCRSWHSVAKDNQRKLVKFTDHQVPMLIVPTESKDFDEWNMYNVLDSKFVQSKLVLPSYDRPFSGSSEGWLLTLDEKLALTLYKPFTKGNESKTIRVPPPFPPDDVEEVKSIAENREYYVMKMAIFTPDPVADPNDLILAVIFGEFRNLAYIRPAKDSTWTRVIVTREPFHYFTGFNDIVYYKDQFYAITTMSGGLVSFDVTDPLKLNIKIVTNGILIEDEDEEEEEDDDDDEVAGNEEEEVGEEEEEEEKEGFPYMRYLVETLGGDLLQVRRYREYNEDNVTMMFKVYKLSSDVPEWVEIKSLGDETLFLGDNTSLSVLASNFVGCQKNCIYFTHDKDTTGYGDRGPCDLGMYNLETKVCTLGFTIDATIFKKMGGRTPIWVLPTIYI